MESAASDEATRQAHAAAHGDPVAVAAFVRLTQPQVWRLCAALSDVQQADDLTQETYLRALKALPNFAGRSGAHTWLLSIARRVCADHIRSVVRRRRLATRLTDSAAPPHAADASGQAMVSDLLVRLPVQQRSAFVLTQVVGLTYAEAAIVDNVAVGTIRSRVARARQDLLISWQGVTVG